MNGNSYRGPTSATQKKVAFPHNYAHRCNIGFRGQLYNGIWVTTRYGERGNKPSTGASLDKWIDVLKTVGDRCVEVQKTLHPISYILGTRDVERYTPVCLCSISGAVISTSPIAAHRQAGTI
ncbi:hypothetical protein AcW1_003651 [Taiwanofungus camphoratus]|nr:hypothetical protein AcW1_003651 [Antrodia cinnamomea]